MRKWLVLTALVVVIIGFLLVFTYKSDEVVINNALPTPTFIHEKKVKQTVAILSDIHNDTASLKIALEKIKKQGITQVLLAGDLTNEGTEDELKKVKKVADDSGLNYLAVPGNHDLYLNKFKLVFGEEWQTKKIEGSKLILINNANWRGLGDEQKEWIEKESSECRMITCLVVMHKPLGHYLTIHVMGENSKKVTEEAFWLNDLLLENKVKQIWVGHLHFNSTYTYGGMETNVVGAISKERNNQTPRFEEVTIYSDGSLEGKEMIIND